MGYEEQPDPEIDPAQLRQVMGYLPTGVTVVTAIDGEQPVGIAIGSFVSISLDPPLVGFFLGSQSGSWPAMRSAGHFCVNVLRSDQVELCGVMASKSDEKFNEIETSPALYSGAPVLAGAHAAIDCRIHSVHELGDHNLIVGQVLTMDASGTGTPMVFYKGQYGSFQP